MFETLKLGNPKKTPSQPEENQQHKINSVEPMEMEAQEAEAVLVEHSNTSSQPQNDEPSHFDDLIEDQDTVEQEQERAQISSKMLTQEQFQQSFFGLHGMAAMFTGLQSLALPNKHVNEMSATEVADALYETILDIPMLHFMLQPGNKWLGRAFVIGAYVRGMSMAVSEEKQQRRNTAEKQSGNFSAAKRATQPTEKGEPSLDQAAALGA